MDRIPGKKYEGNERIQRMNAIRGRLFYEAKGRYVCYLDGDDFYTDDLCRSRRIFWMQTLRTDMWPAATTVATIGKAPAGHSHRKACPGVRADGQRDWSFYIHTNAMMFRNVGLQGIDPYPAVCRSLTISLPICSCLNYLPDCMFNYHQIGQHLLPPQHLSKLYLKRADALQQKTILRGLFGAGLVLVYIHPAV